MAITATFAADFESFKNAVDSADAKLRTLDDGSAKVAAGLTRLGNAFSGVRTIQEATLTAEAITRAGGASTLTEKEMARANATLNEAVAKYKALGQAAPQSMVDLANATKQAEAPTEALGVSFGKLVAGYVTAQAIIGAVKGAFNAFTGEIHASITAANEAEKANVQMVAALRAQGTAVPSVIAAYQGYASALQQTTIYQDDAIEGAIALLVQVGGVMPKDMKKALDATTNLASGLGKDLTSATMLVAKAAEGNIGALKKAGVVIDETKAKQEGFGYILDQITEKFGGQAAAIAGTYEGRLTQLGNTWNNVEESIGRVITQNATLLTAFDLLNQAIASNTGELNTNNAANEAVSFAVIGAAKSFSFVLQALDYVQTAYGGLRAGSDLLIRSFLNIGIAVLDSATAIGTYTKYVNPVAWTSMWANGMREIADQSTFLKGAVQGLTADSQAAISKSDEWGNSIQGLKGKIDQFAVNLEETRGKTIQLKSATDQGTDAWRRNTTAVGAGSKEAEDYARKLAEVDKKIADATRDVGNLTDVQKASVRQYQALGLSNADIAIKMRLSEAAIQKFTEQLKDHGAAVKASQEIEKLFADEGNKHWQQWQTEAKKQLDSINALTVTNFTDRIAAQRVFDDEVASRTLSSYDFQKRQIVQHLADQKAALITKGGDWKAAFDTDTQVANDAIEAIEWKKIQDDIDETDRATEEWVRHTRGNFDRIADGFLQLAETGSGTMSTIAKAIGPAISQLSKMHGGITAANASMTIFSVAMTGFSMLLEKSNKEAAQMDAQWGHFIDTVTEFATAEEIAAAASGRASLFETSLADAYALTGRSMGELITDMHALVQARLDGPEAYAEAIKKVQAALVEIQTALHLIDLVKGFEDANGVLHLTTEQAQTVTKNFDLLFKLVGRGGPTGAEAIKSMDTSLMEFANSAMATGGLVDKFFLDMVRKAQKTGLELNGVNEFIVGQLASAAKGLDALLAGLQASATAKAKEISAAHIKELEDQIAHSSGAVKAALEAQLKDAQAAQDAIVGTFTVTQEQGAGLAAAIVANFAEMVDKGSTFKEALDALKPSIDALGSALTASGVDGGAAFQLLTDLSNIAGDAITGPLLDSINGANQALKGLHNSGILNQDMFSALSLTATQAFNKIIAEGGNGNAALMAIGPTLQTIWQLQKDFGYQVDDSTQALLDQAAAAGIVGDKHRPIAEQMLLLTERTTVAMEGLAKVFGVDIPGDAVTGMSKAQAEMNKLHTPVLEAPWAHWGSPPPITGPGPGSESGSGSGSRVASMASFGMSSRGTVLPFMPRISSPVLSSARVSMSSDAGVGALRSEFQGLRADMNAAQLMAQRREAFFKESLIKAFKVAMQQRVA